MPGLPGPKEVRAGAAAAPLPIVFVNRVRSTRLGVEGAFSTGRAIDYVLENRWLRHAVSTVSRTGERDRTRGDSLARPEEGQRRA